MRASRVWVRAVSGLVPGQFRADWIEEWDGELAASDGSMRHAWGALADAWYLRTEGWTMDGMWRDVRTAVKGLARRPAFTLLAGLTLAVGIGANTAIYSVVDGVLLNPLPLPDPEEVVSYNFEAPGLGVNVPVIPHSEAMYVHFLEQARELSAFAVWMDDNVNLMVDGEPRRLSAVQVTEEYFDVWGVQPALGRAFVEGEDREGAEPVAVLGHGLWQDAFGGQRDVVGRLVEMDGVQRRVVGVMPAGSALTDEELWLPMQIDSEDPDDGSLGLIGIGRLASGATIETASVEMERLIGLYAEQDPDGITASALEQAGLAPDIKPLKDLFVEDMRQVLWVLLGTVGFVLLIACANVANLFLVRAEARQREHALRIAMGATRQDMVRQYLTESLTLAVAGGVVGLGLAVLGVRGLLRLAPADLPQALDIGIDGSVLLFTAVVSIATGFLFGLFPAFGFSRRDLSRALKDGGRASTAGKERHRARSGLVVTQVALALVLLIGSGLMLRSFVALRSVDVGFETAGLLTFRLGLPRAEYNDPALSFAFYRGLDERLRATAGVQAVGMVSGLPLTDSKSAGPMEPVERPFPEGELAPLVERVQVTPGYLEAMAIPILEGRALEWTDQGDQFRAIVVSDALARAFWPGESAVGKSIRNQGNEYSWQIVGVVGDVRFDGVTEEPLAMAYIPLESGNPEDSQIAMGMDIVVKAGGDPLSVLPSVREAVRAADPRLPIIGPRTVESIVSDSMASTSFAVILLGISAGIALLLGTVGIYGVISYIVSRRTQEIGVRMALGAPAAAVLRDVVGQGMRLAAVGVVVGLAGAWGLSKVMGSLLYGVAPTDPLTFASTSALLATVALLACWVPARRASRVDPVEALRSE